MYHTLIGQIQPDLYVTSTVLETQSGSNLFQQRCLP
jgi:hypothetical protein